MHFFDFFNGSFEDEGGLNMPIIDILIAVSKRMWLKNIIIGVGHYWGKST